LFWSEYRYCNIAIKNQDFPICARFASIRVCSRLVKNILLLTTASKFKSKLLTIADSKNRNTEKSDNCSPKIFYILFAFDFILADIEKSCFGEFALSIDSKIVLK